MEFDLKAANRKMLQEYVKKARPLEDMFSVKGKVAVVTGGTGGLGFNISLRLLQGGANVVVASFSDDEADNALSLFEESGYKEDRVLFFKTDVTNEDNVKNLVKFADEKFGSIDIFVNCAAIWNYAHIYDLPEKDFRRVMDVNVTGSFLLIKHISEYMIAHEIHGKMTLISSNCPWMPYPVFGGYSHYAASKGGVIALAVEAAKELKRYGIMVNTVAPGGMATPGSAGNLCVKDLPEEKQDEFYDELMVWSLDSTQAVDEVAIVAYAMCTPMSDGMTGECVVADAGASHNIVHHQVAIDAYPEEDQ